MPREKVFTQSLCADIDGFSQPACIAGWRSAGTRPFRALCPASPCTQPCAAGPTTGRRWGNCAAPSPTRLAGRAGPFAGDGSPLDCQRPTHPGSSPGTNSPPDCLCPGSALANERVQTNAAGQVVLKLKTPWRDGTTHLVMSPLEFMQRLAARAIEERPSVARATATPAPHPFWCPHNFASRSERTPASRTWRAGTQRQAARAGSAASARVADAGRTARSVRSELRAPPPGPAELGQAA